MEAVSWQVWMLLSTSSTFLHITSPHALVFAAAVVKDLHLYVIKFSGVAISH